MKAALPLRKVNNILSIIVCVVALYIIAWPFLPAIGWWVRYQAPVISAAPHVTLPDAGTPGNLLIIPGLGMQQTIHEGQTAATLSKGVWHMPASSTPDKGSNTVFSGHRFTYSGKSVFYYLDKVKVGDRLYVQWDGKLYQYNVTHIQEVSPDASQVEDPTNDSQLTLYTCTPLWSAKNRLVIQAVLQGVKS